jgi:uncharacterized protein with GYD domain
MATYVLMSRLGPDVLADPRGRKAVGKEWKKRVNNLCPEVKWIAHYALLGHYDFMDIYEAPNDEVAHKVSMISRSSGALMAESWPAIPYDRFLKVTGPVEKALREDS